MGETVRSDIFREDLLDGKVVVLSGAGTGLGREATLEMIRLGATVIGCGRRSDRGARSSWSITTDRPTGTEFRRRCCSANSPLWAFD